MAVRACAGYLCTVRADAAARSGRLCFFIADLVMQRPVRTRSVRLPRAERQAALPGSWRDPLAVLLALVTVGCLSLAFLLARDTRFLMPGPLASAHGTIENCSTCHTKSGSGNLGWIHSLVAGDPVADSN